MDFTTTFSVIFNSVNSNLDTLNSLLNGTKMSFPLMTITPKTWILVLATPLGCHLISFSCCIISKKHLCNTTKIVFQLRKCVCAFVCVCVWGRWGGGGGGRVIFLRGNGLHGRQPNMYLSTSYSTEISQSV